MKLRIRNDDAKLEKETRVWDRVFGAVKEHPLVKAVKRRKHQPHKGD